MSYGAHRPSDNETYSSRRVSQLVENRKQARFVCRLLGLVNNQKTYKCDFFVLGKYIGEIVSLWGPMSISYESKILPTDKNAHSAQLGLYRFSTVLYSKTLVRVDYVIDLTTVFQSFKNGILSVEWLS